jgi:hypothetical protein
MFNATWYDPFSPEVEVIMKDQKGLRRLLAGGAQPVREFGAGVLWSGGPIPVGPGYQRAAHRRNGSIDDLLVAATEPIPRVGRKPCRACSCATILAAVGREAVHRRSQSRLHPQTTSKIEDVLDTQEPSTIDVVCVDELPPPHGSQLIIHSTLLWMDFES